jgi:hypothetical protein
MTQNSHRLLVLAAAGCLSASLLSGAISYTVPGSTFNEDFDLGAGLALGDYDWTDNSTFPGWYARYLLNDVTPPTYRATNSLGVSPIGLYVFRENATTADGSLGTRHFDTTSGGTTDGGIYLALAVTNDTGIALTGFTLGYTGEQWRHSTGGAGSFAVSYSLDATSPSIGTYTSIPALDWVSPLSAAGTSVATNGNDPANRSVLSPAFVDLAATPLLSGDTLWIRWFSPNAGGLDQSISIDDVSFSAIPEPSQFALSALVLAWFGMRRRR